MNVKETLARINNLSVKRQDKRNSNRQDTESPSPQAVRKSTNKLANLTASSRLFSCALCLMVGEPQLSKANRPERAVDTAFAFGKIQLSEDDGEYKDNIEDENRSEEQLIEETDDDETEEDHPPEAELIGGIELPSWRQISSELENPEGHKENRRIPSNSSIAEPTQGSGQGPIRFASSEKQFDSFANIFLSEMISVLWDGEDQDLYLKWVKGRKRPARLFWRNEYFLSLLPRFNLVISKLI